MVHFLTFCVLLLNAALCCAESPTEEMKKFIDECYYMIDVMGTCEDSWVDLENNIIDSIDTFATRIVYTEGLILDEADQILEMADRIVETETIVSELIKSCSCESEKMDSDVDRNISSDTRGSIIVDSIVDVAAKDLDLTINSTNSTLKSVTACNPMDDMIKVMDQCIDAFQAFSDDFLIILNSLNTGIQAMGDQIVDTECLIMNMSVQIGFMADEIVATEELMADMASSCCVTPGSSVKQVNPFGSGGLIKKQTYPDNDDVLPDCNSTENKLTDNIPKMRSMVKQAADRFVASMKNISLMQPYSSPGQHLSYLHLQYNRATSLNTLQTTPGSTSQLPATIGDIMPCESIFDPFCCAMEVCSDIMVAMIQDMTDGMEQITELCTDCIDEVAELSDVIVDMEIQIVEMGLMIGDISECIVYFMHQGEQFMVQFCDHDITEKEFRYGVVEEAACTDNEDAVLLIKKYATAHMQLRNAKRNRRLNKESSEIAGKFHHLDNMHRFLKEFIQVAKLRKDDSTPHLTSNPFGEFAEMVDVCLEMSKMMADLVSDQVSVMNHMIDEVFKLSDDIIDTMDLIVDMSNKIVEMMEKMQETEEMMLELMSCFE